MARKVIKMPRMAKGSEISKKQDALNLDISCNYKDLEKTLELAKKLKFELIEVEKQLNKICKLGISKRQLKQVFKNWLRKGLINEIRCSNDFEIK